jgi:hypothetical protein
MVGATEILEMKPLPKKKARGHPGLAAKSNCERDLGIQEITIQNGQPLALPPYVGGSKGKKILQKITVSCQSFLLRSGNLFPDAGASPAGFVLPFEIPS